jgi:type IV pilus assembly protein PilB
VTFVNRLLAEAFVKKASDIHVEPYERIFRVRLRIDGNLVEVAQPPKSMMASVLSRLKIMSQMDISEKRKPQDGRIKLLIGGKPIDYRVSSLPTLFGEKIVLRLLDSSNLQLDMTKLGFEAKQLEVFKEGIHRPYGMCLVTGPTGSGKTTTLYSALAELNTPDSNISTAEDPCEFNLEGCNQVNVKKEVGLTFATALKAFLRQDPDIIMVGEIRDLEVGEIAVEAALTGHLVLSTLHTNDAPATVTRLLNMGIEPFLVVAALNVIVAQRLCRKICMNCREEKKVPIEELITCGFAPASAEKIKIYHGKGCDMCNNTGYKGRLAIYEVLSVTPKIRELILRNASADDLKKQAIRDGMKTLRMCALTKVAQGLTTLEEAVTNSASDQI